MSSTKMRGLFDKNSVPPPPAGRGPSDVPRPAGVAPPAAKLPEPPGLPTDGEVTVNAAFPLLADSDASTAAPTDDPIAHLFTADPPRPSQDTVKAATEENFATLFSSEPPAAPRQVAKVELTRPTPGSAHEITAADFTRDPRSEESTRAGGEPLPSGSSTSPVDEAAAPENSGLFPPTEQGLQGVVFDPDQSIARHLGEVAIDSELGATGQSEALRELPLPQVPAPLSLDDGVSAKRAARSMRPALIVMALLIVSGGAVTLGSLGVLEEDPAQYRREAAEARKSREASPAVAAAVPPAAALPTPPAKSSATTVDPPAAPAAQPAPVQAAPTPTEVAEAPAAIAVVPDVVPAAEQVVAPVAAEPEPPVVEEPTQGAVIGKDPVATGDALLRAGSLDAALVQYAAGLRADSRDHHAMEGLARVHLARGNAEQALSFAEQIVKRRPKRAAYRVLHGQALLGVGDRAGARSAFQEALTLEPGNSEARRLLGS